MPFISEIEEEAMEKGIYLGRIEMPLELRFKKAGFTLMKRIRAIQDIQRLEQSEKSLRKAKSIKEVKALFADED